MKCQKCNTYNVQEALYCRNCGAKLRGAYPIEKKKMPAWMNVASYVVICISSVILSFVICINMGWVEVGTNSRSAGGIIMLGAILIYCVIALVYYEILEILGY